MLISPPSKIFYSSLFVLYKCIRSFLQFNLHLYAQLSCRCLKSEMLTRSYFYLLGTSILQCIVFCNLVSGATQTDRSLLLGYLMWNRVPHEVIFLFRCCVKNYTGNHCKLIIDLCSFLCGLTNMELLGPAHGFTFINFANYRRKVFPLDWTNGSNLGHVQNIFIVPH